MDRPSPGHVGGQHPGMSPHSSSASLSSFLGGQSHQQTIGSAGISHSPGGSQHNQQQSAVARELSAGIMSMSLMGPAPPPHWSPQQPPAPGVMVQGSPSNTTVGASGGGLLNASSMAIRHEIQRFESVHPSIYAIYDLIELVPDPLLAQQIREHVVCIEDSFVNSQEWTLSRGVPDIRLGIVGSLSSGKSALVHRYLTGSYMQEESPEGGRFKKEVVVDGHSCLLLIRDEGGPPELQFTSWVDAVIFVFSLENEASFSAIYNYYVKMSQFRNMQEIPLILVGTQDAISESQPRVIDDARARKLANDLKRCSYYETCATYGLNVERVFQDACQKLTVAASARAGAAAAAMSHSRPGTPSLQSSSRDRVQQQQPSYNPGGGGSSYHPTLSPTTPHNGFQAPASPTAYYFATQKENIRPPGAAMVPLTPGTNNSYHYPMYHDDPVPPHGGHKAGPGPRAIMVPPPMAPPAPHAVGSSNTGTLSSSAGSSSAVLDKFAVPTAPNATTAAEHSAGKELPTPSSTPTSSRKNRRRSNLFTPSKKQQNIEGDPLTGSGGGTGGKSDSNGGGGPNGAWSLGSGRSIPVKQGQLYKKTSNTFSKDWKKKYVTLCDDGRMTYHPSLNDYMSNVHGKEIPLQCVTVKVPGQKPRGSRTVVTTNSSLQAAAAAQSGVTQSDHVIKSNGAVSSSSSSKNGGEEVLLTGFELIRDEAGGGAADNNNVDNVDGKAERTTPNVKKRHGVRSKAKDHLKNGGGVKTSSSSVYVGESGAANGDAENEGNFELHIVSLDNKQWHFAATCAEERDEWVAAIEQQILNSLQGIESSKAKGGHSASTVDLQAMRTIKSDIPGNDKCVDCDNPNPDWASINLGVLICIECSGVHRKLGSHISRVRSLDLDEWPPGHLSVMTALGNRVANSVWEARLPAGKKPVPNSSQEEKERFILLKYEKRDFLAPISSTNISYASHLFNAICRSDVKSVAHVLTHCNNEDVNSPVSPRDDRCPLHVASSLGNLAIVQLLIWSNANVKTMDHEGRTCVSYARSSSASGGSGANSDLIDLLLNNGCPDVPHTGGTLPRRKNSLIGPGRAEGVMEKVTSSVL